MNRLLSKLWAKGAAIILLLAITAVCVASGAGIGYLISRDAYIKNPDDTMDAVLSDMMYKELNSVQGYVAELYSSQDPLYIQELNEKFSADNSNFFFTVVNSDGETVLSTGDTSSYRLSGTTHCSIATDVETSYISRFFTNEDEAQLYLDRLYSVYNVLSSSIFSVSDSSRSEYGWQVEADIDTSTFEQFTMTGYISDPPSAKDEYYYANIWIRYLIDLRYVLILICILSVISDSLVFIFLMYSAGHKEGTDGIHLNWADRIPLDVYAAVFAVISGSIFLLRPMSAGIIYIIYRIMFVVITFIMLLALLMTMATRIKYGKWWKNTVIYHICRGAARFFSWLGRIIFGAVSALPTVWRQVLIFLCASFFEVLGIISAVNSDVLGIAVWIFVKLASLVFIIYVSSNFYKLKETGKRLAAGDLDAQVNTNALILDLREHGDNLNSISAGIHTAVNEQIKSERMKTELITNVSHDIKTPLTSIVNYVDLLKKENTGSDKAREYIEVLDRQSARMKKLIEDLVEVSKASTGNIAVNMEKTDMNVLLSQSIAEYDEKLKNSNLTLVSEIGDDPVYIYADGRLLWRVFDNLMGNVCKYAMEGTRVYISVNIRGDKVCVSFKNISKYALNISSDELMERFVRGDKSRNTEGSGLGLSIARSLTEIQGGVLRLIIDGDLFKAEVEFSHID